MKKTNLEYCVQVRIISSWRVIPESVGLSYDQCVNVIKRVNPHHLVVRIAVRMVGDWCEAKEGGC